MAPVVTISRHAIPIPGVCCQARQESVCVPSNGRSYRSASATRRGVGTYHRGHTARPFGPAPSLISASSGRSRKLLSDPHLTTRGREDSLGREIRKVPANWQHPRDELGDFKPLYDEDYQTVCHKWWSDAVLHHSSPAFSPGSDGMKYGTMPASCDKITIVD